MVIKARFIVQDEVEVLKDLLTISLFLYDSVFEMLLLLSAIEEIAKHWLVLGLIDPLIDNL